LWRVEARDAKNCYTREMRNDLFEQPHVFPAQLRDIKKTFLSYCRRGARDS
jgi:hypothetical protein